MIEVGKLFNCRKNFPDDDHHAFVLSLEYQLRCELCWCKIAMPPHKGTGARAFSDPPSLHRRKKEDTDVLMTRTTNEIFTGKD